MQFTGEYTEVQKPQSNSSKYTYSAAMLRSQTLTQTPYSPSLLLFLETWHQAAYKTTARQI